MKEEYRSFLKIVIKDQYLPISTVIYPVIMLDKSNYQKTIDKGNLMYFKLNDIFFRYRLAHFVTVSSSNTLNIVKLLVKHDIHCYKCRGNRASFSCFMDEFKLYSSNDW